jgi:hypothetical protein
MSALCLFNQTCKLFLEIRAINLMALVAFLVEAFNKIKDSKAPARASDVKCAFKGRLMHFHATKHSMVSGGPRVRLLEYWLCALLPGCFRS